MEQREKTAGAVRRIRQWCPSLTIGSICVIIVKEFDFDFRQVTFGRPVEPCIEVETRVCGDGAGRQSQCHHPLLQVALLFYIVIYLLLKLYVLTSFFLFLRLPLLD